MCCDVDSYVYSVDGYIVTLHIVCAIAFDYRFPRGERMCDTICGRDYINEYSYNKHSIVYETV